MRYITPNVPTSETGTATLGIKVVRTSRRKTKTTRMTRQMEMVSDLWTSFTEARMVVVRSITTLVWMDCGMEASNCGSNASTRSTVSMMLAPGWRKITTTMDGLVST